MSRALSRLTVMTAALFACFQLTGCASVEPWERGVLARPEMALDANSGQHRLRSHAYSSRESAAATNAAGGGGGCGCY